MKKMKVVDGGGCVKDLGDDDSVWYYTVLNLWRPRAGGKMESKSRSPAS